MAVSDWSTTPASNNAAPPNGAPEGMAPSAVNDILRKMMADIRAFYDAAALLAGSPANFTGTLQYGGIEVGYRGFPNRSVLSAESAVQSDNGRGVILSGSSFTFSLGGLSAATMLTILNNDTASKTISASSGTLYWFNGSGTVATGNRTIAVAGVATAFRTGAGDRYIWGTGIS